MGDHNPAVCLFRREVGEFAGDIFVGEAVEAMPLDAPVMECAWDGEGLRQDAAQIRVRPGIQRGLDPLLPLAYLQGQRIVAEIDHAPGDPDGRARAKCKQADLHGGGAGIEGQQGLHAGNPSTGYGAATILASAAEAMRAESGSERLVSTIGTRAPSTRPAAVAPAK